MNVLFKPKQNFTMVQNDLLNSSELSFKAKGLYIYLLSKPARWSFTIKGIASQTKDGYESVASGLNELEGYRLLLRKKIKEGVKFVGIYYYIANLDDSSITQFYGHGKAHNISNTDLSYIKENGGIKEILKPKITLEQRILSFKETVRVVLNNRSDFNIPQARSFFSYWTEMSPNGKKFRMEMERVFDIDRRVTTWIKNNYGAPKTNKKEVSATVTKNS